tara:strand:+ start:113 stop:787 length:675 start_codon:yes stop_codon:yes gene_type:complete
MSKPFNIHNWQAKQKQLSEIKAQDVPGTAAFMGKNMRSGGMSNSEKNKASVDAFFKDLRDKEEDSIVAKGDGIEITQDEMDKLHKDGKVRLKDGSLLVFPTKPLNVKEQTYSGFTRNSEDPASEPFEPTGAVAQFKEELKVLFGKFKNNLKNPEFIKGIAQIMINWKSLLRSQLKEDDIDEASATGTGASFNAGSGEGYMSPNAFGDDKKKKMKTYKSIGYKKV